MTAVLMSVAISLVLVIAIWACGKKDDENEDDIITMMSELDEFSLKDDKKNILNFKRDTSASFDRFLCTAGLGVLEVEIDYGRVTDDQQKVYAKISVPVKVVDEDFVALVEFQSKLSHCSRFYVDKGELVVFAKRSSEGQQQSIFVESLLSPLHQAWYEFLCFAPVLEAITMRRIKAADALVGYRHVIDGAPHTGMLPYPFPVNDAMVVAEYHARTTSYGARVSCATAADLIEEAERILRDGV